MSECLLTQIRLDFVVHDRERDVLQEVENQMKQKRLETSYSEIESAIRKTKSTGKQRTRLTTVHLIPPSSQTLYIARICSFAVPVYKLQTASGESSTVAR